MRTINYFIVLLCLCFSGCAVAPVYKLIPETQGREYHNGRTILSVSDGIAKSTLNFDAQAGSYFSFFVVIENHSDSSFSIYPEDFYAEVIEDGQNNRPTKISRLNALNPENQLETIDIETASLGANKNFNDGMNCLFLGAVVVSDVVAIGKEETEEEAAVREDASNFVFDKIENDEINYQEKKYELEKDRDHWQYEVLRVNTLNPGKKVGGLFYIPISPGVKKFTVIIPIEDKEHIYTYSQERIN